MSVSFAFSNREQQKMEVVLKDSLCKKCSLQFDNKHLFRQHLSLVHGKTIKVKNEPESREENVEESEMKEKDSSVIEKRQENVKRPRGTKSVVAIAMQIHES